MIENTPIAPQTQKRKVRGLSIVALIAFGLLGAFVGLLARSVYLSSTGRSDTSEAHVILLSFACLMYIVTALVISIIRASISREWLYLVLIPFLTSFSLLAFAFWAFEFGSFYLPGLIVTQGLVGYLCATYLNPTWRVIGSTLGLSILLMISGQIFTNNIIGPQRAIQVALEAYERKLVWVLPGFEVANGYDASKIVAYGYSDIFGPGHEDAYIKVSSLPGAQMPNCAPVSYDSSDSQSPGSQCVKVGNDIVFESRFIGSMSQPTSYQQTDFAYNYVSTLSVQKEGVLVLVEPSTEVPPSVVQAYASKVKESLVLWDSKALRGY